MKRYNGLCRDKALPCLYAIISVFIFTVSGTALAATMEQGSFFRSGSIMVYGSQNKATAKNEAMVAFNLKKQLKAYIETAADNRVSADVLKRSNLVILSADRSNSILNFGNYAETSLPIQIKDDYFIFGDKFYSDKKAGIALIYPSPYNAKYNVLVYYSNSVEGLDNLVKNAKITYGNDYQLLNEEGKVEREGKFNKAGFSWQFDPRLDKDYSASMSSSQEMKTQDSSNFKFYYSPQANVSGRIGTIINQYENFYAALVKVTGTRLPERVNVYLYDTKMQRNNDSKTSFDLKNGNVYVVFNNNENDTLTEFARYYFNEMLNFSNDQLIESGFVNYALDLKSNGLDPQVARLYKQNKIPNLLFLVKRETTSNDSDIIIGSFTKYLINNYGIENYKNIVNRMLTLDESDELANITPDLTTSFSRIEREWRYTLEDLARKYRG
jgi:hypothetical protein